MKKELINEVLRMKLLSNYDTKNTFDENNEIILERTTLKTLSKDARYLEALSKELDDILKITGPLGSKGMLKNADDVIFALKTGSMEAADLGKLNRTILKTSKNPALRKSAAGWVVSTETYMKAFSSGTPTQRLAKLKMKNPNMSDEMIRDLHSANELRLKNLNKAKSGNRTKTVKNVDNVADSGRKVDDVVDAGKGTGGAKQGDTIINQTFHFDGKQFKSTDEVADYISQTGKRDFDDLARQNKHDSFMSWMKRDPDAAMTAARNNSKSGKGIFRKILDWGRRRLKWSVLKGLAKIAGVSWLVWYLFFKKDGFEVDCEEGEHMKEGVGCVPDKITGGGDQGGGQDNTKVITDNEGNKYQECTDIYYKGCVNKTGSTDIKKVQDCLGVTPNGFFNQETEDALYKKINKKSFSASDIPTICARSSGSSVFQI